MRDNLPLVSLTAGDPPAPSGLRFRSALDRSIREMCSRGMARLGHIDAVSLLEVPSA
jgi:hypothetical protein